LKSDIINFLKTDDIISLENNLLRKISPSFVDKKPNNKPEIMYFQKLLISLKIASNASVNPAKTRAETIDLMRYSFIHTNLIYLTHNSN